MATLLVGAAAMAVRDGERLWATALGLSAAFVLVLTEWRRRQIKRRALILRSSQEAYDGPREPLPF
jgi:hypothetical protein